VLSKQGFLTLSKICCIFSIGDDFQPKGTVKDSFLPDQTTRVLAEQTNATLQEAVRRDGQAYVQHLDGFIVALREELDSPSGSSARYPPAKERTPYRMDVKADGTGIESPGWFSSSGETKQEQRSGDSMLMSRLCALDWVIVLYESVVPILLKADYAREFVYAIIHRNLVDNPEKIVYKSLEVLAKITVPVAGEDVNRSLSSSTPSLSSHPAWHVGGGTIEETSTHQEFPMTDANIDFAFDILEPSRRLMMSRNRETFSALIELYARNEDLIAELSNVITYMCKLQPPEFVFVSFSVELDLFVKRRRASSTTTTFSRDLQFVSSFVRNLIHVLLNKEEAKEIRTALKDCVCSYTNSERDRQRSRLFHILLHSFSHNLAATISLCFWAGAYRTTTLFLSQINPLDINLMFLLEIDRFVEMLERPLFRHLHVRMLETDKEPDSEGSGSMLFKALKSLLMILPQSTCYFVLKDRLTSISRFRQSAIRAPPLGISLRSKKEQSTSVSGSCLEVETYLQRVQYVRELHCTSVWNAIRADSLEMPIMEEEEKFDEGADRREWLGYASKKEEHAAQEKFRDANRGQEGVKIEEIRNEYHDLSTSLPPEQSSGPDEIAEIAPVPGTDTSEAAPEDLAKWKTYWETNSP